MKVDADTISELLDMAYDRTVQGVSGVPVLEGAKELAEGCLDNKGMLEEQV
ncbi:MAG: hypothetical protein M3P49_08840 [Actinomycetota bacterium]|nr:hypothetical protein [Actinomycetota bacterium]